MSDELANMAEALMDAVCDGGTDEATCGFCGQKYGDTGNFDDSVSVGYLAGVRVVHVCRCEGFMKYARFVLAHRHQLSSALRSFAAEQVRDAERLSKTIEEAGR
ncbi:MAG: hypothetical protein WC789_09520 [Lentisphaeria bacterium]